MAQPLQRAQRSVKLYLGAMLSVNVSLYSSVGDDKQVQMHNACKHDHPLARVKQRLICPECESESDFVKVINVDGHLEEVDPATLDKASAADLEWYDDIYLDVHPVDEVTRVLQPTGKSYYLGLPKASSKAAAKRTGGSAEFYRTLAQVVFDNPQWAIIGRFTIKSAAATYRLVMAGDGVLMLQQMADPDLVRELPVIPEAPVTATNYELIAGVAAAMEDEFSTEGLRRGKAVVLAQYADTVTPLGGVATVEALSDSDGVQDLSATLRAALVAAEKAKAGKKKKESKAPVRKAS